MYQTPQKWVKYFEKKTSDILKIDNSMIQLTSPIQSVVDRAKSELERIIVETPSTSIITAPTTNKTRTQRVRKTKHTIKLKTKTKSKKGSKSEVKKLKNLPRKKTRKNKTLKNKGNNYQAKYIFK